MRIELMQVFRDLVDTASFSRTADLHGVSQSAISQQVAKMEREYGVQLLSRGGGLLAPTQAGRILYNQAGELVQSYERMVGEIRATADAVGGVLRIGTIYSVGLYLLHTYLRRFTQTHPEVDLRVEYTHWSRIYAAVVGGQMDLGVVAYPQRERFVDVLPVTREELVVACGPDHRLAKAGTIEPAELQGEAVIGFEERIPTRRHIDRVLKKHGVEVNYTMAFDNIDTIKRALEVSSGLSILPSGNLGREVADNRLCRARFADAADWQRPLGILRRRGRASSPAEAAFIKLFRTTGRSASGR